ncbi:MAG: hypothetical protein L6R42_006771 [Xanthoria sp. 1 TBL-2021]|nr:MAG: hypothetical protein L6R42_006771 [Xanthoria sp. 1 TBL-2021]
MESARYLRLIPESLGPLDIVDWVPVDLVADIVGELLSSSDGQASPSHAGTDDAEDRQEQKVTRPKIFHIVNPRRTTWPDILPAIIQHQPAEIRSTDYTSWLTALRQSLDDDSKNIDDNPALKLLPFFENIERQMKSGKAEVMLDTRCTEAMSQTMRNLQPVGSKWMENWLRQWRS